MKPVAPVTHTRPVSSVPTCESLSSLSRRADSGLTSECWCVDSRCLSLSVTSRALESPPRIRPLDKPARRRRTLGADRRRQSLADRTREVDELSRKARFQRRRVRGLGLQPCRMPGLIGAPPAAVKTVLLHHQLTALATAHEGVAEPPRSRQPQCDGHPGGTAQRVLQVGLDTTPIVVRVADRLGATPDLLDEIEIVDAHVRQHAAVLRLKRRARVRGPGVRLAVLDVDFRQLANQPLLQRLAQHAEAWQQAAHHADGQHSPRFALPHVLARDRRRA